MIILTTEQADQVRGPTTAGSALDPVPLADGQTFVLPESVLQDPAHSMHHAFLETLPRRTINPSEWPAPESID